MKSLKEKEEESFNYMCIIIDPHHIEPKRRMTITAKSKREACKYIHSTWPTTKSVMIPGPGRVRR